MSNRVNWFEIPSNDPPALVKFYGEVFGWRAQRYGESDYYLLDTRARDGIQGAITRRGVVAAVCTVVYVESLDEAVRRITANGGKVLTQPEQTPGVGVSLYAQDPDGNVFGVMQPSQPT